MELFKILGKIAISNSDANKTIDETTDKAKKSVTTFINGMNKINGVIGKVAKAALITGTASVAAITKGAISAYGDYEQLVGGVETLFKSSSQKVIGYANDAYKTAGLSANNYMETVTSFSASLLKGLGGNTEKAAEVANLAITDMANNANKMGTDISIIQTAYQGFAKQNYTMLDNLKLGYGGTQTEMIRLINDSGVLNKKIKDLDNVSFDTIIQAIHKIQDNMGITGTTAKEASTTIQGSWSALKSSWTNLLTGLADDNADVGQLMQIVGENAKTVWDNVTPHIKTVFDNLISLLPDWAQDMINTIANQISNLGDTVEKITGFFNEHKTTIENIAIVLGTMFTALELANGVIQVSNVIMPIYTAVTTGASLSTTALGGAIAFLTSPITIVIAIIGALVAAGILLWKNWDTIKEKAGELGKKISEKFEEIKNAISEKVESAKAAVSEKFNAIKDTMATVMEAAKSTINEKLNNIKDAYNEHGGGIKGIAAAYMEGVKGLYTAGYTFINNLTGGKLDEIKNKFSEKLNAAKDIVKNAIDKIKSFFNFSWELPKLKMPHFKISGNFSLNPPSVPSFGIEWYKEGGILEGIMTEPTLFGFNAKTGKAQVGGEAGPEAITPIDKLLGMIRQVNSEDNSILLSVLEKIYNLLTYYMPEIQKYLKNGQVIQMDSGALVGAIIDDVDQALDEKLDSKRRGN